MANHHPMLLFLGLAVLALQPQIAAASRRPQPPPWCPKKCGGVDIEYPFGVGPACSLSDGFSLECVHDTPQLRLGTEQQKVKVLDINLLHGKIRTANNISWQCLQDKQTGRLVNSSWTGLDATALPYRFSDEDNRLYAVGCNVLVFLNGSVAASGTNDPILNACISTCFGNGSINAISNGSCSGTGCCEMAIPRGLNSYGLVFSGPLVNNSWPGNNWCSYAVLMEAHSFNFKASYATTDEFSRKNHGTVPVVLNFAAGNKTCKDARMRDDYACVSNHSVCVDTVDGQGYVCNCTRGYTGNPYLTDGCIDIDECAARNHGCPDGMICSNFPGGHNCSCPEGEHNSNKSGVLICEPDLKRYSLPVSVIIAIGVTGGIAIVVMSILSSYLVHQRRALADIKRNYFKRHGGLLLYEELNARKSNAFTIYTEEQLEQATNGFDESNVLGRGGHGTVYKGWVAASDDLVVAIKRCKLMDERNRKEFGKEMLILSQVNHKNIVKLLGCCLEVDVPMLVYEYVPNGTLYHLIHGGSAATAAAISFTTRLRIAHESAESLAYLHSFASPPILHGDVKSSNILLDESFMAKVSDFGASILAPTDEAQMMTMVQGTCGYLDPEYMQTCQLTEKSDVYSFGVVLLELLTGKKPLCLDGPEEGRSLSARFLAAMRENRVDLILDEQVKSEASGELLEEITLLALECLHMRGGERPAMKEVAERLGGLRKLHQHPWTQDVVELEEVRCLLSDSPESISFEVDATSSSGY
uniref:Protein kinase domain-containing protein n=1 Tax=Oryza punctata TaxID=4537 RepID=A0A0E0LFF4_ORYPU